MIDPKVKEALTNLLAAFPRRANETDDEARAALAAHLVVAREFEADDVLAGIKMLLTDKVADFDGKFAPSPTLLARAARASRDRRTGRYSEARSGHGKVELVDTTGWRTTALGFGFSDAEADDLYDRFRNDPKARGRPSINDWREFLQGQPKPSRAWWQEL